LVKNKEGGGAKRGRETMSPLTAPAFRKGPLGCAGRGRWGRERRQEKKRKKPAEGQKNQEEKYN